MSLPELPITRFLPAIDQALAAGHLVLDAPPGSGKTTGVPLALMEADWLAGRRIVMLEPRRPAARMAAHRMASLLGERTGERIGYQVRFERRIGPHTRVEVLTEGLLLRRLQRDPELADVGLVIFDEFHERSLTGDLSLSLCLDVVDSLRDDLHLMPMSASLDGKALADRLGARHIQAEGRSYPVQVHYLERDPAPQERLRQLVRLIHTALDAHTGDLLVFLPGKGEISTLQRLLAESAMPQTDIRPLHAGVASAEQDAIIRGGGPRRRIVHPTDIAETSLTLNGIGVVIDAGLNRKPRLDPATGLTRLQTGSISRASALQRAGRAGRQGPGVCYRAWSEARQQRLEPDIRPQILDADLAPAVLELAGWGVTQPHQLTWITPPPEHHWTQARELLQQLGALDSRARITATGRAMLQLPTHPRLAHLLVAMKGVENRRLAADIAALLEERDPALRSPGEGANTDIRPRLEALDAFRRGVKPDGFHAESLRRIDRAAGQLLRLLNDDRAAAQAPLSPGLALAFAFPDRIARARGPRSPHYLLRGGRAASLPPNDGLTGQEYLVAAALDAGAQQGRIWLAAPLSDQELEQYFADQIREQRETGWDRQAGAVRAWRRRRLGALILSEQNLPLTPDDEGVDILLQQVRAQGLGLFDQAPRLRQLQARVALLQGHAGAHEAWPDLSDETLLRDLDDWLAPWLEGVSSLQGLRGVDIMAAIHSLLGWDRQQRLQHLLPDHYTTPAGTRRPIEYATGEEPVLRAPLQEMLGERQNPTLADGRIPLVLHLLSPAMRPLQITRDLSHFWQNAYVEVRKEMRGRYPKHHWPEDPLHARATRLGRRKGSE